MLKDGGSCRSYRLVGLDSREEALLGRLDDYVGPVFNFLAVDNNDKARALVSLTHRVPPAILIHGTQ